MPLFEAGDVTVEKVSWLQARRARESGAYLQRSSAGRIPARNGRYPVGVGRRNPDTTRNAFLIIGSILLLIQQLEQNL